MDKMWPSSSVIQTFLSLLFILASFFIWQTTATIPHAGESKLNSIVVQSNPPALVETQIEGSGGANPDDEDGDVNEEGSGDGMEGSGAPPVESIGGSNVEIGESRNKAHINVVNINNNMEPSINDIQQTSSSSQPAIHSTTTTPSSTTTTQMRISTPTTTVAIKLPTMVPTIAKPKYYITTTTPPAIMATPRNENRPKQPPTYLLDPTNPLDGLRPGIFAAMIGGAVVALLLTILVFTYALYRIRKKDEGTYVCEESNLQPHHYSYAYQKASIKEFYA